ncbi:receptor activity-modifying protein 1 [Ambystoma mexicanum]|uniref:receptor activity-modifying protein 1 n=1 Tax=Ambystoma mexicanum TaxID=8296 RepID=UPI0037E88198
MALELAGISGHFLCFLIAHHCIIVAACDFDSYTQFIEEFCLEKFRFDMDSLGPRLWCNWDETLSLYLDLTNCTYLVSENIGCFWPNHAVDNFFTAIHRYYFKDCSLTGRSLGDPPYHILCPFIVIPILMTLLMTGLVVWRSKRSEGIV